MIVLTKKNFFNKSEEEKKDFLISNFTAKELAELVIKYSDKPQQRKTEQPKKMKISKTEFEKYFEFSKPRQRRKKTDDEE